MIWKSLNHSSKSLWLGCIWKLNLHAQFEKNKELKMHYYRPKKELVLYLNSWSTKIDAKNKAFWHSLQRAQSEWWKSPAITCWYYNRFPMCRRKIPQVFIWITRMKKLRLNKPVYVMYYINSRKVILENSNPLKTYLCKQIIWKFVSWKL